MAGRRVRLAVVGRERGILDAAHVRLARGAQFKQVVLAEGAKLGGEARRRVVIETARRLTAIGGDILKAEFPYDPAVMDRGRWRDACAELDRGAVRADADLIAGTVNPLAWPRPIAM